MMASSREDGNSGWSKVMEIWEEEVSSTWYCLEISATIKGTSFSEDGKEVRVG